MAGHGADVAVETVMRWISQAIEHGRADFPSMLREVGSEARAAVVAEAQRCGVEPRELASTLLVTILGPDAGSALQIGDGVIVVGDHGEEWCWVFWPQRGEYVNTTRFLTDDDAAEWIQIEPLPGTITEVALMTDGLEPLALQYATKTIHEPFFRTIFQPLIDDNAINSAQLSRALESFLGSDRVAARTDDDVSLIMATRRREDQNLGATHSCPHAD